MNHYSPIRILTLCLLLIVTLAVSTAYGVVPSAAQNKAVIRVALSSADQPTTLAGAYGLLHYGGEFGLNITKDDFTNFATAAQATQVVLSGQAEVVSGSFVSQVLVRQAGQDFKTFCLRNAKGDLLLIGRNGVTKLDQLLDPKTRVSVDSPGGVSDTLVNAMFQAANIKATVKTLPNVHIIEAASDRATALVSNQIDVTILTLATYSQIQKQMPDSAIIARLYETVPLYLTTTYAAPKEWLDSHLDEATGFCASVIKAQRALSADYNLYSQAVKELLSKPPSEAILRQEWKLIHDYDTWNLNTGVDAESVKFMVDIMVKSGVLTSPMDPDDILDLRPYQGALKLLGPYIAPTEQATPADAGSTAEATSAATPKS